VGTIAVTPPQLQTAAAILQRAGGELQSAASPGQRCTVGGDFGSPELERAVSEVSTKSLRIVFALWTAVGQAGVNASAAAFAYQTTDGTAMGQGGP
jgi:hypothetical protein